MPFRALLITLVTVTLALLAWGMWMRAMAPMLAEVNASTQPSASHPGLTFPTTSSTQAERPDRQFKAILKAGTWATFLVICILFVIGFFTTLRAWMQQTEKRRKTRYVDAWKIAGERLEANNLPQDEEPGPF